MIKCKINNQEVEVPEGTSIISAFKQIDQAIAHYCWHPGLSVAGVCRLCMVEIEGIPKLQIACNTEVKEGMNIHNQSEKVKSAVRWGLEFHLINHPLDCPICDQAGECELQEQYMHFGRYSPNMAERKVKKRKVIDLGSKIVLDSERCILCSRCVRFTEEVTKTNELGIFNRGDKSEIGIFKDKPLENEYAVNTVDICPVGALTSKDFRFQQRVWYLKTANSICQGCSTGCNIEADYNEEGIFRVRPRYNKEVNGHWMCDRGREVSRLPNKKDRLMKVCPPQKVKSRGLATDSVGSAGSLGSLEDGSKDGDKFGVKGKKDPVNTFNLALETASALTKIKKQWVNNKASKGKSALVLTAQYTVEEYEDLIAFFLKHLGKKDSIYYWKNHPKTFNDFDGLLLRGDKNPNTKGLLGVLNKNKAINSWENLSTQLEKKEIDTLWVAGPENQKMYPDLEEKIKYFESYSKRVVWWTAHPLPVSSLQKTWQIPTKTFFEKDGTFVNFAGVAQKIKAMYIYVPAALSLSESAMVLSGEKLKEPSLSFLNPMKTNYFTERKKVL